MQRTKVEVFTSTDNQRFFTRKECQLYELDRILALRNNDTAFCDFILSHACQLIEIIKPSRKARTVKPKEIKTPKRTTTILAPAPKP